MGQLSPIVITTNQLVFLKPSPRASPCAFTGVSVGSSSMGRTSGFSVYGIVAWSKFIHTCRKVCQLWKVKQGRGEMAPTVLPEMALHLPAEPVRWGNLS